MLRYHLKLIYRNFKRFKGSFFINLIGLSTGMACAILIYLWVNDELRVDKFHEKDGQLFQVMQNLPTADGILTIGNTPTPLAKTLLEEMPEVEYAISVIPPSWFYSSGILSVGDKHVKTSRQFADTDFFNVFSYNLVQGDKNQVLSDKNAVLLSDELAMKLFHTTEDIVGKTVEWKDRHHSGLYQVSGIFEKPPHNSTAQFDLLFPFELFFEKNASILNLENWGNSNPNTYVALKKGTNVTAFNDKIRDFIKSKLKESVSAEFLEKHIGTLFLQRYSDRYLYNHYENGVQSGGRIMYVKLFSVIALFLLAIACINFMNLSTAKASRRIKEIGIKKAIGAERKALIFQFLGESLLMAFLSSVIALLLVALLLPQFNVITGKQLSLNFSPHLLGAILGITLITGLFSGSYPALYLSRFNPAIVLKGKLNPSAGEAWVRKGLVVFQFAVSVILIVSVLVVYKQIEFIQTKNLGYNKDNILSFKREGRLDETLKTFLQEIRKMPGVVHASSFGHDLVGGRGTTGGLEWEGENPGEWIQFGNLEVGYDWIEMLGIEMVAGRTFSREFGSDSSKIIFNEAAIAAMGLKDPIGKTIKLWGKEKQIIGVTKNFHFESLYEPVKPCFMQCYPNGSNILVKIQSGMEKDAIEQIRGYYQAYNEGLPFDYKFLDQDYQALYAAEQRVSALSKYFAGLAIIISCLGLFGLAAFTAERRQKEIGIRKVLGASVNSIMGLLSKDFVKLVLIAIALASPLAWYAMSRWLEDFAFRIEIQWWMFVLAGGSAVLVALMAVGFQSVKAALINPVKSLRSE